MKLFQDENLKMNTTRYSYSSIPMELRNNKIQSYIRVGRGKYIRIDFLHTNLPFEFPTLCI